MAERYHYDIAYITDAGNCRGSNQDSLLVRRGSVGDMEFMLLAVADGMGGLLHGERASEKAVTMLDQWWNEQMPQIMCADLNWVKLNDSILSTIERINWEILNDSAGGRSGTTLTAGFVFRDRYNLFQVGDSRAYHLSKGVMTQVTRDQSFVQQEYEAGRIAKEDMITHPKRHVLVSTLGVMAEYTVEQTGGELSFGEGLLLCSDGFYSEMEDHWCMDFEKHRSIQELLELEKKTICSGTASDNLTAVMIRMDKGKRQK